MSSSRTRSRGLPWALGAGLGVIYLLTMATDVVMNDAQTAALTSWRIAQTGAPWLEGYDYAQWSGHFGLWVGEAENGHLVGFRAPGPIAAAVPTFLLLALVGVDGYVIGAGSATAALLTAAAMVMLYLALRPSVGTRWAVGGTLAVALSTPVWSVSADSLLTHPVTLLGIAGMAWASVRERWWLVGLFGGVALWGRLHTALIVATLGAGVALVRRRPRVVLQVGLASGAALVLATVWSRWMYGWWNPAGGYGFNANASSVVSGGDGTSRLVNHLGLWVSPDRGILVWTPVLVLLAPTVWRHRRHLPDWSRWLAIGGVLYTLVQGQLNGFSGGSSFYGYRLTLELLVCVTPAFVMSTPRAGRVARALIGPLLGLQCAVISLGAIGEGGISNEDGLWTRNSFVFILGHAPALVLWPLLLVGVGWALGRVVWRRVGQDGQPTSRVIDASRISARDDLDRV